MLYFLLALLFVSCGHNRLQYVSTKSNINKTFPNTENSTVDSETKSYLNPNEVLFASNDTNTQIADFQTEDISIQLKEQDGKILIESNNGLTQEPYRKIKSNIDAAFFSSLEKHSSSKNQVGVNPNDKKYHWSSISSISLLGLGVLCWIVMLIFFLITGVQQITMFYLVFLYAFAISWMLAAIIGLIAFFIYYRKKGANYGKFKGKKLAFPSIVLGWLFAVLGTGFLILGISLAS